MKKSSTGDKKIDNAVMQMLKLAEDAHDVANDIDGMLRYAFDLAKPEEYPEIIEDAQSVLKHPLARMKQICDEFKKRHYID